MQYDSAARLSLVAINNLGQYVQFDSLKIVRHTNNINGHETLVFQITLPATVDSLPIDLKNWVGLALPGLWGWVWEGTVGSPAGLVSRNPGDSTVWEMTAIGLQNVAKNMPPLITSGLGKSLRGAPETMAGDSCLLGAFATNVGTPGQAAVTDATGSTISERVNLVKNQSVAFWWDEFLQYGDSTARWDWALWIDPQFGTLASALRAEVHFQKRSMTPAYVVDYANLTEDTKISWGIEQVWDQALWHYQTPPGATQPDLIYTYTPPSLPPFVFWPPGATSAAPLTRTYFGDLGTPGNGDTPAGSQIAARAASLYASELAFRLSSQPVGVKPDCLLLADGTTPIPNEAARAGRVLQIRGIRTRYNTQTNLDVFITQTSCDDQTGVLTCTPQSPTDARSNRAMFYKRPGSAKASTLAIVNAQ